MNQTQKLVFAASIWTRTNYQIEELKIDLQAEVTSRGIDNTKN